MSPAPVSEVQSALQTFREGLLSLFGNANDCHDPETGQFCEDAASLGITIGKPERVGARLHARIISGYKPTDKRAVINTLWHWQGSTGVREQGPMHHWQGILIDRRGDKSHLNECHDERGMFCETGGAGSSSGASETAKHAAINPKTGGRVDKREAPTDYKSADGSIDFSRASEEEITAHFARGYNAEIEIPGMQDPEVRARFSLQVDKILSDFQSTGVLSGSQAKVRILCPTKDDWDNEKTGFGQPAFPVEEGAWMITDTRGYRMSLNPYVMSDMSFMESEFAKGTEWHAEGVYNFEGAVTHEMGHMLENSLKWNHDTITGYYTYDKGEIGKAFTAYADDNSDAKDFTPEATQNKAERFAEAFAAHYHGSPAMKATSAVSKMSTLIGWTKSGVPRSQSKYYKDAEHPGAELKRINAELAKVSSAKAHMNDCHDDRGQFCEGGGSSLGEQARASLEGPKTSPKPRRKTGIGPEASIHTAEKRGKEYGYAKKVSFYQCTDVDQANEINAQMAELSDETGLVVDRVYVYKKVGFSGHNKEAPKNSAGYHQGRGTESVIGIQDKQTAKYCFEEMPYKPGENTESGKWFIAKSEEYRTQGDVKTADLYKRLGEDSLRHEGYSAHTVIGNGARNPTVDHEFAHALVHRAVMSSPYAGSSPDRMKEKFLNPSAVDRLNKFGSRCREQAKITKFSVYGAEGQSMGYVYENEPIAETYAYWKAGGYLPEDIVRGLVRLEHYRGPGTGT